jgi:hypothetical protein
MDIDLKSRDSTIYNKNGIDNDCNKNDNDNSDFNDNINGNNDEDNYSHRDMTLTIGCTELWLVCLKTLVNLTHNCPAASDILLSHQNHKNLSTGEIISRNSNPNPTSTPIPKTDFTKASINTDPSTSIKLKHNLMCVNLMEICCIALSIFISWRNEAEFVENKKEDDANKTGGTYACTCIYMYVYKDL